MKNFLKWVCCFFLVPVGGVLVLGGLFLVCYLVFNFWRVAVLLGILGVWIWLAADLKKDIF